MYLINGIFAVIKPYGISSAQTLTRVKNTILKNTPSISIEKLKFGHGGTLDHCATGVLVVGAGTYCSRLKDFLSGEKSYETEAVLGIATDTYNSEGKVTMERSFDHVDFDTLEKTLQNNFVGKIQQIPPVYSAIKLKGERYADLARRGIDIKPSPRMVHCFEIKVLDFSPPSFSLLITCGGGFYIRSLVHDVGLAIQSCAHITKLKRVKQGPFSIEASLKEEEWSLENIRNYIKEHENLVNHHLKTIKN